MLSVKGWSKDKQTKFPSFDLGGKVAIVTGGGQGIGRAVALSLAHFGALVAVADKNLKGAEKVAGEIRRMGKKSLAVQVDIGDLGQIARMVDEVVKAFGGIDILVNNAGILVDRGPAQELTPEDWDKTMAVNLRGLFFCSQAVGKVMIEQGRRGKIINVSSEAAFMVLPKLAAYNTSKGGIISLTRSLAIDWARYGINVNAIAPTFIRTSMTEDFLKDEAWHKFLTHRIPLGRPGEPEDIAGAVIFLASPASDLVTGHTLLVDGGWTAGELGI